MKDTSDKGHKFFFFFYINLLIIIVSVITIKVSSMRVSPNNLLFKSFSIDIFIVLAVIKIQQRFTGQRG